MYPDSNMDFAQPVESTDKRPLCLICEMPVSPLTALTAEHDGRTWYFCGQWCHQRFLAAPDRYS